MGTWYPDLGVRIIARRTLTEFVETLADRRQHTSLKAALDAWFYEVQAARWNNPSDVKKCYGTASIIDHERVVFDIKGNKFRLVVSVDYGRHIVFIKWVGSHTEYDKIDVQKVQYEHQTYQKRRGSR